ncbi:MAG: CopG family transcriptional regulator [Bryobacteraceae bacterium]|jgi:hypothetical protein
MAQLTIYLPDAIESKARKAAKAKGKSVSKWIADEVVHSLDDVWPKAVLDAAGAFPDFPSLKQIRAGAGRDLPREQLG